MHQRGQKKIRFSAVMVGLVMFTLVECMKDRNILSEALFVFVYAGLWDERRADDGCDRSAGGGAARSRSSAAGEEGRS